MKPYEREALLERVDREGATVGASIPEKLDIDGETVQLRETVLSLQDPDTDEVATRASELTRTLRRTRKKRYERLESETLTKAEGETLARELIGIDRALASLGGSETTEDVDAAMREQDVADAARWRQFVKRARGDTERSLGR